MNEKPIRSKSDIRKRSFAKFTVRVNEDEHKLIMCNSENTSLHPATLMRELATGYKPKSITDHKTTRELLRIRGVLGKTGGLLKMHINQVESGGNSLAVGLIHDIENMKEELRVLIDELHDTIF